MDVIFLQRNIKTNRKAFLRRNVVVFTEQLCFCGHDMNRGHEGSSDKRDWEENVNVPLRIGDQHGGANECSGMDNP